MDKKIAVFNFLLILTIGISHAQDKVIRLYSGKAPGSESWTWTEKVNDKNMFGTKVVYNVVDPTLTVFEPAAGKSNGTAVVIAPGGGFRTLSINDEGFNVASWLAEKGVTCFVLKYRLAHSVTDDPVKELVSYLGNKAKLDSTNAAIIPLAISDGLASVEYVRAHAAEYQINPARVGFMGFSAGGTVTMGVANDSKAENRPNFIAPIYAYISPLGKLKLPPEKMPAFIVAATDDQLGLAPQSVEIYSKWLEGKQSAELHMYAKGGHGFGVKKQKIPTDTWIDRFGDWLGLQGLLTTAK